MYVKDARGGTLECRPIHGFQLHEENVMQHKPLTMVISAGLFAALSVVASAAEPKKPAHPGTPETDLRYQGRRPKLSRRRRRR